MAIGFDDDVVDVDVYVTADLICKALLHAPLVSCASITKAEGHGGVAERSVWRDERRFLLVFLGHLDLIVAAGCIEETE